MSRHFAKLVCLVVGGAAGWAVLINLAELFSGWIPPVAAGAVMALVFMLLYFPLVRPVTDIITDRLYVMTHRGRHIRTGSGLNEIPEPSKQPTCSICGGPDGPICTECDKKMTSSKRSKIDI
ncbi:MAG: hypothetical protein GY847_37950 [Proteobacteria bacterium]|nr:hypothetical protein [Pseudomonadota bacterium]